MLELDEQDEERCRKDMFVEDMTIARRYGEFSQKLGNMSVNLKSYEPQPSVFYQLEIQITRGA
jgi:hypothetical protein